MNCVLNHVSLVQRTPFEVLRVMKGDNGILQQKSRKRSEVKISWTCTKDVDSNALVQIQI